MQMALRLRRIGRIRTGRCSSVAFDAGAAGIRVYQVRGAGARVVVRESLLVDLISASCEPAGGAPSPEDRAARLARMLHQADFVGSDVTLVVSPPDVEFYALKLPQPVLLQPFERVHEALRWEVSRESRREPAELEIRWWHLPPGHAQGLNIMAASMHAQAPRDQFAALARVGLHLRRIDVAPCCLTRLACRMWSPAPTDLWGILDLGFRHATLTVLVGDMPAYVRCLPTSVDQWTRRLAAAIDAPYAVAEQLKREYGVSLPAEQRSAGEPGRPPASDLPTIFLRLTRDLLDSVVREVNKCFAYVLQSFADVSISRLVVAGGGSKLRGLTDYLETQLGVPVVTFCNSHPRLPDWRPDVLGPLPAEAAAAVGAALGDLEAP